MREDLESVAVPVCN